ncbi:TCR/Tet family MFS transporter [Novosphingobium sp. JCM 18896]|uniref:TCR/Tet family MFS transporter n=1 Tax=Novosphingobium sp. JCM 18896 TaxID=2989731 RepID=UPI0022233C26|nr:TCR/Tet family MFS transporter [Novosphingobium sp. JCM 18896]MCW1430672.1 TCR/Tet family MFS transporter [Novosphingobium sp. JCM 18896]
MDNALRQPAIWMVLVAAFLDMMAMGIVMPVLPGLIEDLTGSLAAAGIWTGVIGSLWALMQFVCAPIIGGLSDRFGRRPVILISTAGLTLDWVLMALAPTLWWLVIGRIIGGITSASATALFAYMADVTAPERRARAFGLIGAAISAGFVLGPAIGGILGEMSPRLPFWVAAGFSGAAFFYGLIVLPESLPPGRRSPFTWRSASPVTALRMVAGRRELSRLALSVFLLTFSHRLFMTIFVLFAGHQHGLSTLQVGALLAFSSVLDLIMQGVVVGPATARFGDRRTTIVGLVGGMASFLAMGLAPNAVLFVVAMIPASLMGLAEPTLKSMLSRRVAESEQGRLQGAMQSLASVAGIVGPVFFGWIYAISSASLPGLGFAIAAGILAMAAIAASARTPGPLAEPQSASG